MLFLVGFPAPPPKVNYIFPEKGFYRVVEPSIETGYQISLCKLGLVYILAIYAKTADYDYLNT